MPLYNPPVPTYTWASKPATYPVGQPVFISNVGTKGSHWFYDGTRWKPVNGMCVLATLDSASSGINATDTIVFQYQLPASLLTIGDCIRFYATPIKSGTTNTGLLNLHVGAAGTTSDTIINNGAKTILSAAQQQCGAIVDLRAESSTTMRCLGVNNGSVVGYGQALAGAQGGAQTLASSATLASSLWVSVGINGGATDTVLLAAGAQIQLVTTAN